MDILLLIIALAHVLVLLLRRGLSVMVAPASSCYVAPRAVIFPVLTLALLCGVFLSPLDMTSVARVDTTTLFLAFTSALVAYVVCSRISEHISVLYLLVMAMTGRELLLQDDPLFGWHTFVGWVLSLLIAFVLAMVLYKIISRVLSYMDDRYLRLLQMLGVVISFATILLFAVSGLNVGALFELGAMEQWEEFVIYGVVAALIVVVGYSSLSRISALREREFDINPQAALAIILSASLTIALFTFEQSAAVMGVEPVVISPLIVLFSSLMGCAVVQNRNIMSSEELSRMVVANVFAIVIALLVGYFLSVLLRGEFGTKSDLISLSLGVAVVVTVVLIIMTLHHSLNSRKKTILAEAQAEMLDENRRSLNRLEVEAMEAENENLRNQLELKRKEVMSIAMNITEQKEFIHHLYEELKRIRSVEDRAAQEALLDKLHTELSLRMNFDSEIDSFYTQVEQLHKDFSIRLMERFPELTRQERRLTILLRLDFSTKYIATLMNISPKSVEIARHRLRAKLGLQREQNLTNFIKTI